MRRNFHVRQGDRGAGTPVGGFSIFGALAFSFRSIIALHLARGRTVRQASDSSAPVNLPVPGLIPKLQSYDSLPAFHTRNREKIASQGSEFSVPVRKVSWMISMSTGLGCLTPSLFNQDFESTKNLQNHQQRITGSSIGRDFVVGNRVGKNDAT